jgi:hypothetical protein
MFPPGVRSDVSRSISNEFRCSFTLYSLLIFLLTSLLTPHQMGTYPKSVVTFKNYPNVFKILHSKDNVGKMNSQIEL